MKILQNVNKFAHALNAFKLKLLSFTSSKLMLILLFYSDKIS